MLTAAVRHVDPGESAVVDVLDAARRLVALDTRHLDRVTDAAHLASTDTMHAVAREVTGGDRRPCPTPWSSGPWPSGWAAPRAHATTSASARSTCPSPSGSAWSRA